MRPFFPVVTLDQARQMAADLRRARLTGSSAPPLTPGEIMEAAISALLRLDDDIAAGIQATEKLVAELERLRDENAQLGWCGVDPEHPICPRLPSPAAVKAVYPWADADTFDIRLSVDPPPGDAELCRHEDATFTPDGWQCPCGAGEQRLFEISLTTTPDADMAEVAKAFTGEASEILEDVERAADARRRSILDQISQDALDIAPNT